MKISKNLTKRIFCPVKILQRNFCSTQTVSTNLHSETGDQMKQEINQLKNRFSNVIRVEHEKIDEYTLTPHQRWLTQGHNMERPFTGEYLDLIEPGSYSCVTCDTELFK